MKLLWFGSMIALGAAVPVYPAQAQNDGNIVVSREDCTETVAKRLDRWQPGRFNIDTRCKVGDFKGVPSVKQPISRIKNFNPETRAKADCLAERLRTSPHTLAFGTCGVPFPGYRGGQ